MSRRDDGAPGFESAEDAIPDPDPCVSGTPTAFSAEQYSAADVSVTAYTGQDRSPVSIEVVADWGQVGVAFDPADARALARQLLDAADECDADGR